MTRWDAGQYLKFEDERTRAARDLVARVPLAAPARAFDLGCGPGNSTELLIQAFPEAEVTGVDSSPEMLAEARRRLPGTRFVEADLARWTPELPDEAPVLLFANAVFQWVPDHQAVFARLLDSLPGGGVLAVQMPDNLAEPSHVLMRDVAREGPWAEKLAGALAHRDPLPEPGAYYDRLKAHAARVDVWHVVYNHPLDGAEAIVEWVKGTGLRPFLDPLTPKEREAYLADYTARLGKAYAKRVDGKVLLAFPRLFLMATR
ncbi:MAG: trans-aconitate 2-methyltransferase [Parvibaculaceae bacterium]